MKRRSVVIIIFVLASLLMLTGPRLGSAQEPYYKGKQIRIIVGLSSGGGYDRAARMLARFIGKYIPGNPEVLVQNMPGAGSVTAANYVWGVAKPDGLTLLAPHNNVYLSQLSGQKEVQFDLAKFQWIGSLENDDMMLFSRADAPYKSIADIIKAKEQPKCGSTGGCSGCCSNPSGCSHMAATSSDDSGRSSQPRRARASGRRKSAWRATACACGPTRSRPAPSSPAPCGMTMS